MAQTTEKAVTLYAYKIENERISKSYSEFYDKFSSKLQQDSSVKQRCMPLSDDSSEFEVLASFIITSNYIWGNLMRIAPTKEVPNLPDDFLERKEISYSELEGRTEDETKKCCKSSYFFVVNKSHLVTNMPKTRISQFKTYVNWLLEAERGDTLYKFSILIQSPIGTKISDINKIIFSGESSMSFKENDTDSNKVSFKINKLITGRLSSILSSEDLSFLVDRKILSANLVVNVKSLRKGSKDEDVVKKALSAVITPMVDDDGVSFITKDKKPIKAGEMIKSKKVLVDYLGGGLFNEQDLRQNMLSFLNELKGVER